MAFTRLKFEPSGALEDPWKKSSCFLYTKSGIFIISIFFVFITTMFFQILYKDKDIKFIIFSVCSLVFWFLAWPLIIKITHASVLSLYRLKSIDDSPNFLFLIDLLFSKRIYGNIFKISFFISILLSSLSAFFIGVVINWGIKKFGGLRD